MKSIYFLGFGMLAFICNRVDSQLNESSESSSTYDSGNTTLSVVSDISASEDISSTTSPTINDTSEIPNASSSSSPSHVITDIPDVPNEQEYTLTNSTQVPPSEERDTTPDQTESTTEGEDSPEMSQSSTINMTENPVTFSSTVSDTESITNESSTRASPEETTDESVTITTTPITEAVSDMQENSTIVITPSSDFKPNNSLSDETIASSNAIENTTDNSYNTTAIPYTNMNDSDISISADGQQTNISTSAPATTVTTNPDIAEAQTESSASNCFGTAEVNTVLIVAIVVGVNVLSIIVTAFCVHRLSSRQHSWDPPPMNYSKQRHPRDQHPVPAPRSGIHLASDNECRSGENPTTQIPIVITNEDGWVVPYRDQDQKKKKIPEEDTGV